jgi:magnesium-transporting ATPase (P-type)
MGKKTVNVEPETPFHTFTVEQVAEHYQTSILEGLSSEEAAKRLQTYGHNELEGDGGVKWYKVLWRQVANVLVCVLLIATVSHLFSILYACLISAFYFLTNKMSNRHCIHVTNRLTT